MPANGHYLQALDAGKSFKKNKTRGQQWNIAKKWEERKSCWTLPLQELLSASPWSIVLPPLQVDFLQIVLAAHSQIFPKDTTEECSGQVQGRRSVDAAERFDVGFSSRMCFCMPDHYEFCTCIEDTCTAKAEQLVLQTRNDPYTSVGCGGHNEVLPFCSACHCSLSHLMSHTSRWACTVLWCLESTSMCSVYTWTFHGGWQWPALPDSELWQTLSFHLPLIPFMFNCAVIKMHSNCGADSVWHIHVPLNDDSFASKAWEHCGRGNTAADIL